MWQDSEQPHSLDDPTSSASGRPSLLKWLEESPIGQKVDEVLNRLVPLTDFDYQKRNLQSLAFLGRVVEGVEP